MDLDQSADAFLVREPCPVNSVQVFVPATLGTPDSSDDSVYTPVVRFKTASGKVQTFTSAVSVGSSSRYKVRTTIPVLYDPDDVIPPRIDSWATIWGVHIVFLFGGLVGFGLAAFVYWVIFPLVLLNRI